MLPHTGVSAPDAAFVSFAIAACTLQLSQGATPRKTGVFKHALKANAGRTQTLNLGFKKTRPGIAAGPLIPYS
jgi:hypothetical protein